MTLEQKIKEAIQKDPNISISYLMMKFKITKTAALKFKDEFEKGKK